MSKNRLSLSQLSAGVFTTETEVGGPTLFAGNSNKPLSKAEQADLLQRVLDGEKGIVVEIEATTYIQRDTPNRKFVRFSDKVTSIKKVAKSGTNTPFLLDHSQGAVSSRGGTVVSSAAEKNAAGEWEFKQRIRLVKAWAVEGVLDGTIDRFSIGWHPSGSVTYRHSGDEVEEWPKHYPGDTLEDGTRVEFVYNAPELTETSGVNVPAVTGTEIEIFMPALSAAKTQHNPHQTKDPIMKKTIASLGLSEAASDDAAAEAVLELKSNNKNQEVELSALREQLKQAQGIAEKAEEAAKEREAVQLEADIADLYKEGKLAYSHNATGKEADPMEQHLRKLHAVGRDMFDGVVGTLHSKGPITEKQASAAPKEELGGYDSNRLTRLRSAGMSPERHAELAAKRAQQGRG